MIFPHGKYLGQTDKTKNYRRATQLLNSPQILSIINGATMELEEQQRNIDQQHLIEAVSRQHTRQNGSLFSMNRDLMRRQMGTPAFGFATPLDREDLYEHFYHLKLSFCVFKI